MVFRGLPIPIVQTQMDEELATAHARSWTRRFDLAELMCAFFFSDSRAPGVHPEKVFGGWVGLNSLFSELHPGALGF